MVTDEELRRALPANILDVVDDKVLECFESTFTTDTGQVVETPFLKSCPFCDCEDPYIQTYERCEGYADARVVCPMCHVSTVREYQSWKLTRTTDGKDFTRLAAIAKAALTWNRRSAKAAADEELTAIAEGERRFDGAHPNAMRTLADDGCGDRVRLTDVYKDIKLHLDAPRGLFNRPAYIADAIVREVRLDHGDSADLHVSVRVTAR